MSSTYLSPEVPSFFSSFPSTLRWESIRLLKKWLYLHSFIYLEADHKKSIGEGQGKGSLSQSSAVGPATQWMVPLTLGLWDACTTGPTNRDIPHGIPAWNQPIEFSLLKVPFSFSSSQLELGKHLKWQLSFWILIGVGALSFPSLFRTLLPMSVPVTSLGGDLVIWSWGWHS